MRTFPFGPLVSLALLATLSLGVASASAAAPTVVIDPSPSASFTTAQVSGTINPEDNETFWSFEYSAHPEIEGWSGFTFQGPLAANSGSQIVTSELAGLKPGTKYFVRLVAWNLIDPEVFSSEPNPSFTTTVAAAPTISIEAPSAVTGTSAHFSGHIDPGGTDPAFNVNWHFQCTPECPGLEGEIPADTSSHQVEADATGLKSGTTYEVSLVATNADESATAGPETFTTPTTVPQISGTAAIPSPTEATLTGRVNPGGLATSYHFDYGSTSSYGQSTAVATIPASSGPLDVSAAIGGLSLGSTYHFRLVATNALSSVESGDRTFTTVGDEGVQGDCPNEAIRELQGSTYLPDCRGYEQVSPVGKNVGDVTTPARLSSNGRAISWISSAVYAPVAGSNGNIAYVGRRGETGWTTTGFSPAFVGPEAAPVNNNQALGNNFDGALSVDAVSTNASLDPGDKDFSGLIGRQDIFLLDPSGTPTWISHAETLPDTGQFDASLSGYAEQGGTYFFTTAEPLTAQVPSGSTQLQLYRWRGGKIESVGFDPSGAFLAGGSGLGASVSTGGQIGNVADSSAVSTDGSRFVFSGAVAEGEPRQLFLHVDGRPTIQLSLSQRTGSVGQPAISGAKFVAAASDLGKILIYSADQLTNDAPVEGGDYWYDVATGSLTYSNPDETSTYTGAPNGVVRVAPDGSRVYFAIQRVLAPGATAGEANLYVKPADSPVAFIATLNSADFNDASGGPVAPANQSYTTADIDEDGDLIFQSVNDLAGYEADGHVEIYRYEASTGKLSCVSCRPNGTPPSGDATLSPVFNFGTPQTPAAFVAGGREIFFTTTDALVPRDTNGQADVYEYENGTVHLITSGLSSTPSFFTGAAPDGRDVYFTTREALVRQDKDGGLQDIYDARVEGGFSPAVEPVLCSGEQCQGEPTVPPRSTLSGSASVAAVRGAKATLKVRKTQAKGVGNYGATLKVTVSGPGVAHLSGRDVSSVKTSLSKSGTKTVRIALSASGRQSLTTNGHLETVVTTLFEPGGGGRLLNARTSVTFQLKPKTKGGN